MYCCSQPDVTVNRAQTRVPSLRHGAEGRYCDRMRTLCRALLAVAVAIMVAGCAQPALDAESLSRAVANGRPGPSISDAEKQHGAGVQWDKVDGALGYEILHSVDGGGWGQMIITSRGSDMFGASMTNPEGSAVEFVVRTVFAPRWPWAPLAVSDWSDQLTVRVRGSFWPTTEPSIPAECNAALEAAGRDLAGDAELEYEASLTECMTVDIWVAAAKKNPLAFGLIDASYFDPKEWLDLMCYSYPTTPVCRDYELNGI